jgi:hypothetical protein
MKDEHFREEIPIQVAELPPGHFEWWTVGLDIDDGHVEFFVAYGGIQQNDAPAAVVAAAVMKWREWLERADPKLFVAGRSES